MLTHYTDICMICGKPSECKHHLIGGSARRRLSDKDGLIMPLCHSCHNMGQERIHGNIVAEKLSKMMGQLAWEKVYYMDKCDVIGDEAREAFRKRYGKSYL